VKNKTPSSFDETSRALDLWDIVVMETKEEFVMFDLTFLGTSEFPI
jgi:hypothetical protein